MTISYLFKYLTIRTFTFARREVGELFIQISPKSLAIIQKPTRKKDIVTKLNNQNV